MLLNAEQAVKYNIGGCIEVTNVPRKELAKAIGISAQSFSGKLRAGRFSYQELMKLANRFSKSGIHVSYTDLLKGVNVQ